VAQDGPSTRSVFEQLAREQLVDPAWADTLTTALAEQPTPTPWFVRGMVGVGAWLAAILLVIFVGGLGFMTGAAGFIFLGLASMAGACAARYRFDGDFPTQMALAVSLAGQGLFVTGLFQTATFDDFEVVLWSLIVINAILVAVFPDKTHRFLSVALIVGPLTIWLYIREVHDLLAVLGPALAALFMWLLAKEPAFVSQGWHDALTPIRAGILFSAFGVTMMSTIYVLPQFVQEGFQFYPRPWLSTVLYGAMLLLAERQVLANVFGGAASTFAMGVYISTAIVAVAAWPAPGMILSLLVIVIASVHGLAVYRGAGIAFLAVFTTAFFYGIDVGMLTKSASLIATGVVVLACRWLFLRSVAATGGMSDA